MENNQPIAVGYVRVSTKYDEQATSPVTQRELIERECKSQGWRLERFFEDTHSGWRDSASRPDYRELKRWLTEHRCDYIVVADVSRMSRDLMEYLVLSREVLEPAGVELYLVRGVNGPGRQVELVRIIDAWIAENYSVELSRKTADGLDRLARGGGWGSVIPYGYRSSKRGPDGKPDEPCVLWIHDGHAAVLREMFKLSASGTSARAIARRLNARGTPSPKGAQWCTASVLRLLKNRVYLGEVWHNGELMDKGHVPLITAELFDRVNARARRRVARARVPGAYLLPRVITSHWLMHRYKGGPRPANYHGERLQSGRRCYRRDPVQRSRIQRSEPADELAALMPQRVDADTVEHVVMAQLKALAEAGADGFWELVGQEQPDNTRVEQSMKTELSQLGRAIASEQRRLDTALDLGLRERALEYSGRLDDLERRRRLLRDELETQKEATPQRIAQPGGSNALRVVEQVNIAVELWQLGEREKLRDFLAAIFDHIDLRTDGERLLVVPVLHDLPELRPAEVTSSGEGPIRYTLLAVLPLGILAQRRWLEQQLAG